MILASLRIEKEFFIVGFLDHNIDFEFPTPTGIPTRVGDILEDNVDKSYTISDKLWAGHQRRKEANKLMVKVLATVYLMKILNIQTQFLQDTIKTAAKF